MAERMTTIRPIDPAWNGTGAGFCNYGRLTRDEILEQMRRHYQYQLETAQAILAMPDEAFIVETHTGVYVRRNIEEVE